MSVVGKAKYTVLKISAMFRENSPLQKVAMPGWKHFTSLTENVRPLWTHMEVHKHHLADTGVLWELFMGIINNLLQTWLQDSELMKAKINR